MRKMWLECLARTIPFLSDQTVERQLGGSERSFVATSLETGKSYIVTIIAYRGYKRSKVVETVFKTGL